MKSENYVVYVLFIIAVSMISSISYSYAIPMKEKPTDNAIENYKQIKTSLHGIAGKKDTAAISLVLSPLKQMKNGVAIHDIKCKNDLVLVLKSKWTPICVKPTSMTQFTKRELIPDHNPPHNTLETKNESVIDMSLKQKPLKDAPAKPKIDKTGFKKAPKLTDITGYINTNPEELESTLKGKVILYDFWTYGCYNCQNTLPYVIDWHQKYADQGLLIIGIHTPEFEFEKDINNVKKAVEKYGIKYPVVLDNDEQNWIMFGNHYWPRFYLADSEGYIRYDHIGEGSYDETELMIQKLLQEKNMPT